MKSLSKECVNSVLEQQGIKCSYDDFCKYMAGDTSKLNPGLVQKLSSNEHQVINKLKEMQNADVVELLIDKIKNDKNFQITELNNYGDNISSYFTKEQLDRIAKAYQETTGKKLSIVTAYKSSINMLDKSANAEKFDKIYSDYAEYTTKGAIKESGYTSAQVNTKQVFSDGSVGNGEMQVRGLSVDKFGDVEHIPYDIRTGKIKADDPKYKDIYDLIKGLSNESYNKYNEYLSKVYRHLRLEELGISTPKPEIGTGYLNKANEVTDVTMLTYESLLNFIH